MGGIFDFLGICLLEPQRREFYMEFCLSFPTSEHVDAFYLGCTGLYLQSPGIQTLWPYGGLEPASYHKLREALGQGGSHGS